MQETSLLANELPQFSSNYAAWSTSIFASQTVAVLLFVAGIFKAKNRGKTSRLIEAHRLLSRRGSQFASWVLPEVEIALGTLLMLGLETRGVLLAVVAVLMAFTVVQVRSIWLELAVECGCFGGNDLIGYQSVIRNGTLLALCFLGLMFSETQHEQVPQFLDTSLRIITTLVVCLWLFRAPKNLR